MRATAKALGIVGEGTAGEWCTFSSSSWSLLSVVFSSSVGFAAIWVCAENCEYVCNSVSVCRSSRQQLGQRLGVVFRA